MLERILSPTPQTRVGPTEMRHIMTITEPDLRLGGSEDKDPVVVDDMTIAEIDEALDFRSRPSFESVVTAIMTECHLADVDCSERQARQIIGFFRNLNGERRSWGDAQFHHHLSDRQIRQFHEQLDVVVPDDTVAQLGSDSAHAMLEQHVLGDEVATLGFYHSKEEVDRVTYCDAMVGTMDRSA